MIGALIKGAVIESFLDNTAGGGNKPDKGVMLDTAAFPQSQPMDYTPFVILAVALLGGAVFIATKQ